MIRSIPTNGDYGTPAAPDWRRIDWATYERDTLIDGRRVHHVDLGQGQLGFVLVHGMGGCWQHWLETIPFLSQRGHVLALDLPGFGCSQLPEQPISLDLFADTAATLARNASLEHVIFIGHSMGGPIALRFAQRHPELASGLILLGGAVHTFSTLLGRRELWRLARGRPKSAAATFTEVITCAIPTPFPVKRLIAEHKLLRELALWPYLHRPYAMPTDGIELVLKGAGTRGVLPTARAIGDSDPYQGLSDVRCPILSIGGRYDHIVPTADFEAFDQAASSTESVLIEGAGHMAMLERPRAVNDQIELFLTGHKCASLSKDRITRSQA